jgi:hypothetical protein
MLNRVLLAAFVALVPSLALAGPVNWGDYQDSNQTIYLYFNSTDSDGVAATLTSGAVEIYEDGSATQITTAETLDNDFDSITGYHQLAIDLTDAGFEDGKTYTAILTAGTVDSVSVVGRMVGVFSVGRYASVTATGGVVQANLVQLSDSGLVETTPGTIAENFGIFFDNGDSLSTTIISEIQSIRTRTDRIPNIAAGASGGLLIAGSNAATTFATLTSTGAMSVNGSSTGAHLTALPWNASWDAEVQSEANDALVANNLDHLLLLEVTGSDVTDNSVLAKLVSKSATADWDTFVNTTDSLEAIKDAGGGGGGGSVAWDDLVADNDDVAGSFGKAIADILVDTGTSIPDQLDDINDAIGSSGDPVAADVVDDSRTWFATDYRARNIITVAAPFEGTLALKPDLNPGTTIIETQDVTIVGPDDEDVTANTFTVNRAKDRAHCTVPEITEVGDYAVTWTVETVDGQVLTTTATLKVQ